MPKTYLRYEPDDQFAVVNSSVGSLLTHCGRFVISGCYDVIVVRNAQTHQIISKMPVNKDA